MTKDKFLFATQIAAIITAIADIGFILFAVIKYSLLLFGVVFVKNIVPDVMLAAIIVNAAFLFTLMVYFLFRKK